LLIHPQWLKQSRFNQTFLANFSLRKKSLIKRNTEAKNKYSKNHAGLKNNRIG